MLFTGLRNRSFGRPSKDQAVHKRGATYNATSIPGPLGRSHCLSPCSDYPVVALIVGLLNIVCPSAVVWGVVTVIVLAIDGSVCLVSGGQCPLSESYEVVAPFVTDGDASAAISGERSFIGIEASVEHGLPRHVQTPWLFPMRLADSASSVSSKASARLRGISDQTSAVHIARASAIALTRNEGATAAFNDRSSHSPSSESGADWVVSTQRHGLNYTALRRVYLQFEAGDF
jgi:hypothetical protein